LHRHPFATEAYELGFAVGVREDYGYQAEEYSNVDLPVNILDNDFRDPDLDRYLERFEELDPSVGIVGDAYSRDEARELNRVAEEILEEDPFKQVVAVPKCRRALDALSDDVVLGYAMGYSDVQAEDFSKIRDWRGKRVHLLGASPPKQYEVIQDLTQPTLFDDLPADIVGLDWNGVHGVALKGEYWSRNGWQSADHLSVRETVRKSLQEIKRYWQERGVWPDTEPIELYGEAVEKPDEFVFMDRGGDPIPDREALEDAYVEQYSYDEDEVKWAFQSEAYKEFVEWREGLV
jgi:hypothetical protein